VFLFILAALFALDSVIQRERARQEKMAREALEIKYAAVLAKQERQVSYFIMTDNGEEVQVH